MSEKPWEQLLQVLRQIRQRLPALRDQRLKEYPTRACIIDPILEALGWNVREPEEVELEFGTIDGKAVDYALKINGKPVVLVEAKGLSESLDDVKGITQVVGYAANAGVDWCVLTNGVIWRVYRSVERCLAPEKLLFEVNIDPRDPVTSELEKVAQDLWRLSREQVARGVLDELGARKFTDAKVRRALLELMTAPAPGFINVLQKKLAAESLSRSQIKESLARLAESFSTVSGELAQVDVGMPYSRTERKLPGQRRHSLEAHLVKCDKSIQELYRQIEEICLNQGPGIQRRARKFYVAFRAPGRVTFCSVLFRRECLKVLLLVPMEECRDVEFARDVSGTEHVGRGSTEFRVTSANQLKILVPLIRRSYEYSLDRPFGGNPKREAS